MDECAFRGKRNVMKTMHGKALLGSAVLLVSSFAVKAQQPQLVMQTGHSSEVTSVAFSPDGKVIASGSDDNSIKLWNVATGRLLRTLSAHSNSVYSVAFSPDGKTLATGSTDKTIKLWDVASGRLLKSFMPLGSDATPVAFSPDGKILAGGASAGKIKLWLISTGRVLLTLKGHCCVVYSVAFAPDGQTLASVGTDDQVKLWDVNTGQLRKALRGHITTIHSVVFSPDGKTLASGGSFDDKTIKLWDVATGLLLRSLTGHTSAIYALAFSRDGKTLVSGGWDNQVKLWDVAGGRELPTVMGHSAGVACVASSPDGTIFASGSADRTIKLWDTVTRREQRTFSGSSSSLTNAVFSPDNRILAFRAFGNDSTIKLRDVATGGEFRSIDSSSGIVTAIAFSPDGKTLVSGSEKGAIELWDVASGQRVKPLRGHSNWIWSLSFSADGKLLVSASADRTIYVWKIATGQILYRLSDYSSVVLSVALSPDGKTLASGGDDATVKLWDVATGRLLRKLIGHSDWVWSVGFSHDGKRLASAGTDTTVKIWDVANHHLRRNLEGNAGTVYAVAFSTDDRIVVSGQNATLKLWEEASGKELANLIALDPQDWLVTTPDGLFDGSPPAWSQIYWRFSEELNDISPAEIFFSEFFYPGLLTDIIAGKRPMAPRSIAQLDRRQPQVKLTLADEQPAPAGITKRSALVRVEVTDAPAGARDVRLFRNGSLVKLWSGDLSSLTDKDGCQIAAQREPERPQLGVCTVTVPIVAGQNNFTAYAFNHDNIKSENSTLSITGADSLQRPSTLYILAVGVGQSANTEYNLKYSAADAQDFGDEVKRQQASLGRFGRTEVIPLVNQDATKTKILAALRTLADTIQPEDGVIVYFSGHGTAQGDRFYLIPHDIGYMGSRKNVDAEGLKIILSHSISDLELEKAFRGMDAGQLILVIDACNSGQALESDEKRRGPMNSKGLAQLAYEKGMYILTASQSVELAFESEVLKHSYLTFALVEEGLKTKTGDADANKDGQIVLREWFDYATREVPLLRQKNVEQTAKQQHKSLVEVEVVEKGKVQQPRVFYRREPDAWPLVVAKPGLK